jgi:hypothetical protein
VRKGMSALPPKATSNATQWNVRLQPPNSSLGLTMDIQRFLIGLGLVILAVGIVWPILSRIGLGRLPGDIMYERGGTTFYFPLATCIIVSVILSVLLWLFNR